MFAISPGTMKDHRATWWVYGGPHGEKIRPEARTSYIGMGWDAACRCGWESRTGGATKASVIRDLWDHRFTCQSAAQTVREATTAIDSTCAGCSKHITLMYRVLWTADDGTTGCKYVGAQYIHHEPAQHQQQRSHGEPLR